MVLIIKNFTLNIIYQLVFITEGQCFLCDRNADFNLLDTFHLTFFYYSKKTKYHRMDAAIYTG